MTLITRAANNRIGHKRRAGWITQILKAVRPIFNHEQALVGAISMIVKISPITNRLQLY